MRSPPRRARTTRSRTPSTRPPRTPAGAAPPPDPGSPRLPEAIERLVPRRVLGRLAIIALAEHERDRLAGGVEQLERAHHARARRLRDHPARCDAVLAQVQVEARIEDVEPRA